MTNQEIIRSLKTKLQTAELLEIYRSQLEEYSLLANPLLLSEKLFLFENAYDFSIDGIKIIRNKDITELVFCDKNDSLRFNSDIYRGEKLFCEKAPTIDLKNWGSVFEYYCNQGAVVSIDCIFEDAIDYYVGKIIAVKDRIATMRCFDGSGNLFKDDVKINLDFVTTLTYGDRYTTVMAKYIKWN